MFLLIESNIIEKLKEKFNLEKNQEILKIVYIYFFVKLNYLKKNMMKVNNYQEVVV